jgi:alginate O-acetyltransferase complex protein AlgI
MEPCRDALAFFSYVSFFPQLVAGPIERAHHLLPQFLKTHSFRPDEAADGLRQMLWGLMKKIVIADNCAPFVNAVFSAPDESSGAALLIGTVLFAFQIYGDFSGYSDIAIGTAKLFGFDLMRNFAYPYFSRDIAEFWRRWHISLTTWFRDYVYIPLGGNRRGKAWAVANTFIVFLLSGLWHGANWTFVIWGALNACFFLPLMLSGVHRKHTHEVSGGCLIPRWMDFLKILLTFSLVCFGWIFFRSETVSDAVAVLGKIFSLSLFEWKALVAVPRTVLCLLAIFVLLEWVRRHAPHPLVMNRVPQPLRWAVYYFLIYILFMFAPTEAEPFIYFQF